MNASWTSLLWFGAIVVLIPLALWLLKRTPLGANSSGGVMRSVAVLPLSASQRIVTVEVGTGAARRWLVLGVSAQQINTLHTMEAPPEDKLAPPSENAGSFAALLGRMRQDR
jgi:flagellar protein FliO/FliZ